MPHRPRFVLIGNPKSKRTELFQEALRAQRLELATVLSYRELINGPEQLSEVEDVPTFIRIDSVGKSFDVERGLLRLGYKEVLGGAASVIEPRVIDALDFELGRIIGPRQAHLGYLRLLGRLKEVFWTKRRWRILNQPDTIATLFDKRLTSGLYQAARIPIPEPLRGIASAEQLRDEMRSLRWRSVFVKLSCGSSASCLAVYHLGEGAEFLMTTIERTSAGWFNTRQIQRVNKRVDIDELLTFLIREGSQIERSVPKACLDGAPFDCRVVMIDHEPAFVIVRQNRHPITNLHLLGWRGELSALRRLVPEPRFEEAMESCVRVSRMHESFQLGIDLLFDSRLEGHRIIESNAFGDLFPGVVRDGLSIYEWQLRRLCRGGHSPTDV